MGHTLKWHTLKQIPKFTPKAGLERRIGTALFRLEDRPAWYYGGGVVVYYTPRRFRVEGIRRVEYGETGLYAVGMYHFPDPETLKLELGLDFFDADDAAPLEGAIVEPSVTYESTFDRVRRWADRESWDGCMKGVTERLVDGRPTFLRQFLRFGPYELYFYGKSPKTKVGGFRFTFAEGPWDNLAAPAPQGGRTP